MNVEVGTRNFSDCDLSVGVASAYSRYTTRPIMANPPASCSQDCTSPPTSANPYGSPLSSCRMPNSADDITVGTSLFSRLPGRPLHAAGFLPRLTHSSAPPPTRLTLSRQATSPSRGEVRVANPRFQF